MLEMDSRFSATLPLGHDAACQGCRRPIDSDAGVHLFAGMPCPGFQVDPRRVIGWTTQTLAVYNTMTLEPPPRQVWWMSVTGGWWNYYVMDGWCFTPRGGVPVDADTTGTEWWWQH